jgi:hypothetical protein
MADAAKRFHGPAQLTASAATLYTVPANTTAIVRYIRIANTTATDRTVTLSIGADAAATRIFSGTTVPANGSVDWSGFIPMTAAEIVQGLSSAATALTVVISGIEVT